MESFSSTEFVTSPYDLMMRLADGTVHWNTKREFCSQLTPSLEYSHDSTSDG